MSTSERASLISSTGKGQAAAFKESEESVNDIWTSPRTPIWVFTFLLISVIILRMLMETHVIGWGATIDNTYKYEALEKAADEHNILKAIGKVWEEDDW